MLAKKRIIFLNLCLTLLLCDGYLELRPKIRTQDGNLIIESAKDKNITVRLQARSWLNVNNFDLLELLQQIKDKLRSASKTDISYFNEQNLREEMQSVIIQMYSIDKRLRVMENSSFNGGRNIRLRNAIQRISRQEIQLNRISTKLDEDDCSSNPCKNGGTCFDSYETFTCTCLESWQGATCEEDVNECSFFEGTDLGCQNNAQCINTIGGYSCVCSGDWLGVHCTKRRGDCLGTGTEICGHGTCINSNDGVGYKCVCDQGWQTNGVTPACTVDVDECTVNKVQCSTSCLNLPGTYSCTPCPSGFTGNGHICRDIDECLLNDGGCSKAPKVSCLNTQGSYHCSECPFGWSGDGRTCSQENDADCNQLGICHPSATCQKVAGTIFCVCPHNMTGYGVGPNGCTIIESTPCSFLNPCQNGGTCVPNGHSYVCQCVFGTVLPNCERADPCETNPCLNGGTCSTTINGRFRCTCKAGFRGRRCQAPIQSCGGRLRDAKGIIKYPLTGTYGHNKRCAWLITINETLVLNVTFTKFDLEYSEGCPYDFLQIHDGASAAAQLIGRFCGQQMPKGGNIISTHESVYLWFHSDNSSARDGFELMWDSIAPSCGGFIDASQNQQGAISSPGSPGNYPQNRDCQWLIQAPPGRRLQIVFFSMQLESHETCGYDYLAIYSGSTTDGEILEKYCNTSHPPRLVTPSNEAVLHFHSDEYNTDLGFQLHYTVIEGFPGCGGIYSGPNGEFGSPSENGQYPHNLDCEYVISFPRGSSVQLHFITFDLESSENCRYDALEIFSGRSDKHPKVGKWCGNQIPPDYKSDTNELMIKFHTDSSFTSHGFRLSYEMGCGGVFSEVSGILTSPMYPNKYFHNRICDYLLEAPVGKAIKLSFLDFDLETGVTDDCIYDFVEIFDGINKTADAKYCGSRIPPEFLSTHNIIHIRLHSDISEAGRGFKANYTFFDTNCGGILKKEGAAIRPPSNTEGFYQHDTTCLWMIMAPPGYIINLIWISFRLEESASCSYDYVEIYDDSSDATSKIGRFCGNTAPPVILSTGGYLTIKFVTDSSNNGEGFAATFFFVNARNLCGGTFYSTTGVVFSPNWPDQYSINKNCVWIIKIPAGQQIELSVKDFGLETSSECIYDYLEIRNGGHDSSALLGKYCGNAIPAKILSFTNELYIKFHSDSSSTDKGFEIEWNGSLMGCGGVAHGHFGTIASPNYPMPYTHNAQCDWRIVVSKGSVIKIIIADIDLEGHSDCIYDSLQIFDGFGSSRRIIGKYCSSNNGAIYIVTSQNEASIRLTTDVSRAGKGFQLHFYTDCNREIQSFRGVIESPNFPLQYPHNTNCEWTIKATQGNLISISFSHFDLEEDVSESDYQTCSFDFVTLNNGDVVKGDSNRFCSRAPPDTNSTSNVFVIKFVTDSSIAGTGFRLEYQTIGCGGTLTRPFGEFNSINYPNRYPHATVCEWQIQTSYGTRIELTIKDLDVETSPDCYSDGILIANGKNESLKIASFCAKLTNITTAILSNGNLMFVRFYADSSQSGRGFSASYKSITSYCGGSIVAGKGFVYSPEYPHNYVSRANCDWLIQTDDYSTLNLTIIDFDLEYSSDCIHDFVKIYDGESSNDESLILHHCGADFPSSAITSTGSQVLIVFQSDESTEAKGFKIAYAKHCGKTLYVNDSGTIEWDNSDFEYDECVWRIISSDIEKHVSFIITELHDNRLRRFASFTEDVCSNTGIEFFDGDSLSAPLKLTVCSGQQAHMISSIGHALTMRLHKTYISTFKGYYSIYDNACGGRLSSIEGKFASPGYPDSYPAGVECEWSVIASEGNAVQLNLAAFNLPSSDNCNEDYLEAREGGAAGKILGVFCGEEVPPKLVAQKEMWIKFRSESGNVADGFMASYSYEKHNELRGTQGLITSPGYPNAHYNERYSWRIEVERGNVIKISLNTGLQDQLVHFSDPLTIYDGYDETAVQIQISWYNDALFSSTSVVYMVARYVQFKLEWSSILKFSALVNNTIKLPCEDEQIKLDSVPVTLSSPGYPMGYAANKKCSWTISTTDSAKRAIIVLDDVDTDDRYGCFVDYVKISKSNDLQNWSEEGMICKLNKNENYEYRGDPFLKVEFITDYLYNKTGFSGTLRSVCGGILTSSFGTINGTQFKDMADSPCEWRIRVRNGRKIKLQFTKFNIEKTSNACLSYVMVKDGADEESPVLGSGKLCGTEIPSLPITSSSRAFVKYILHQNDGYEWELSYAEVMEECYGNINLDFDNNETSIESPNFPNPSPSHIQCIWIVIAPNTHRITVQFERLQLANLAKCESEFVEIKDGSTSLSASLGTFCNGIPNSLQTTGNICRIKFFTDTNENQGFFKAKLYIAKCGGLFVSPADAITSENYPLTGGHPSNSICDYRILRPQGSIITITIVDISLPDGDCNSTDNVKIYSVIKTGAEVYNELEQDSLCGQYKDRRLQFSARSNEVLIRFTTTEPTQLFRGFHITYNSTNVTCGGSIEAEEGTITSPGYPIGWDKRSWCVWKITVPKGRRIKLEILDYDITGPLSSNASAKLYIAARTSIYNDFQTLSRIIYIVNDPPNYVESSDNKMLIKSLLVANTGCRGFKMRFTSNDVSYCEGSLSETEGVLTLPRQNLSSFFCEYTTPTSRGNTLVLDISRFSSKNPSSTSFCNRWSPVIITSPNLDNILTICSNLTNSKYILPASEVQLSLRHMASIAYSLLAFDMRYKLHKCGDILSPNSDILITSPRFQSGYGQVDCVWQVSAETDALIKFEIHGYLSLKQNCAQEYITIYNGDSLVGAKVKTFCENLSIENVTVSEHLVIKYHSDSFQNTSSFNVSVRQSESCGGILVWPFRQIKITKDIYKNNIECEWEVSHNSGFHIGVEIIGRFFIEESPDCRKDYLQFLQYKENKWSTFKVICGRNPPNVINSTEARIKIVFRTDESGIGDGFTLSFSANCGGIFDVVSAPRLLSSPNYPDRYPSDISCNYTLIASKGKIIKVVFLEFELEKAPSCVYDNLTIYAKNRWTAPMLIHEKKSYCEMEIPEKIYEIEWMSIVFKSDSILVYKGFQFQYSVDECGGEIFNTTEIKAPYSKASNLYPASSDCFWNITGDRNKKIVIIFEKVEFMISKGCQLFYVEVYSGRILNPSNRIAKLCSNFTDHSSAVSVVNEHAIVHLHTDVSNSFGGFTAFVIFMPLCDKNIVLSESNVVYRFDEYSDSYSVDLDCNFVFRAPNGYHFEIDFTKFHVATCARNTSNTCSCDFLEFRDGGGPFSELIGKYCGHEVPNKMLTTKQQLYVRFVSDSATTSSGFSFTVTIRKSECGTDSAGIIWLQDEYELISPGYPKYAPNLRCTWTFNATNDIQAYFEAFDLQEPDDQNLCRHDILEIVTNSDNSVDYELGVDTIAYGKGEQNLYFSSASWTSQHQFCGNHIPGNFMAPANVLRVRFHTDDHIEKSGFKLKISVVKGCHKNYTSLQGRIQGYADSDCEINIQVPVNYSLSLYFTTTHFEDASCESQKIEVYNLKSSADNKTICGGLEPAKSIFFKSSALKLKITNKISKMLYDMTYLASSNGPGCGGRLFNYEGIITSPYYPANTRNISDCRWDIRVPQNLKVALIFDVFDLGAKTTCQTDFLEIIETEDQGITDNAVRRYCGEDQPAIFRGKMNYVAIRFKTTVNYDGTGWVVSFKGVHENTDLNDMMDV